MPSLRGVGYSLQTAIADIVDNSISAGASLVSIDVDWNQGSPVVAIIDDGRGLDETALIQAMRFGCDGPRTQRSDRDLGRFGLGLKTASLSQARRLTVASVADGGLRTFYWDLDHITAAGDGWELLEGAAPGSERRLDRILAAGCGTLVLWEKVDFGRNNERPDESWLREEMRQLESHLGMVFHRYLEGSANRLEIQIGGRSVAAWDPFLERHEPPADRIGEDVIPAPGGRVRVAGFVMPHRDRFRNDAELSRAGGPDGWNAHQGCYVYRADRLLTAGGWMGLGRGRAWTREEASRLARIRIDIPTSGDAEWQIDVKKSVARPPAGVRARLERLAESVRQRAREVYVHRGARRGGVQEKRQPLWILGEGTALPRYRIDRNHPAVAALISSDPKTISNLLSLIEKTVPIDRIWLDRSEGSVSTAPSGDADLVRIAVALVQSRIAVGDAREAAILSVATAEPFDTIHGIADSIRHALRGDGDGEP